MPEIDQVRTWISIIYPPPLRKRTPTECIQGNGPTLAVASSAYFINKTSQQDYGKEYNNA